MNICVQSLPICAALCLNYLCVILFHSLVLKDAYFSKCILPVKVTFSTEWSKQLFFWFVFIGRNVRLNLNLSSSSAAAAVASCKPLQACSTFMDVDLFIFSLANQHLFCWSEFIYTLTLECVYHCVQLHL